jgi:rhomboid protease GluP
LAGQHRFAAARKLASALVIVHPSEQLRRQVQLLGRLESGETAGFVPMESAPVQDRRRLRDAPAVLIFISLNILAFLIECFYGGWNDLALHQLGALEPSSVLFLGEYWRLITSLFLHAGPVHLLFNLFALYVLGVPLERSIGSIRFCFCYLIAGVGSTAGVTMLARFGLTRAALLVGASGAIMGIVGAWAAFLLLHRDAPAAKQRLSNLALIIAIQIAFDLSTPQVSMSAHLCGLVTGFFVGLLIAPRKMLILAS